MKEVAYTKEATTLFTLQILHLYLGDFILQLVVYIKDALIDIFQINVESNQYI